MNSSSAVCHLLLLRQIQELPPTTGVHVHHFICQHGQEHMEIPLFVETWGFWVVSWLSGLKLNLLTAKWYSSNRTRQMQLWLKKRGEVRFV